MSFATFLYSQVKRRMENWDIVYIVIALLAILITTFARQTESMSNDDVNSAIQSYGVKSRPNQGPEPGKRPIYGPKSGGMARPTVEDTESKTRNGTSAYPGIYGPDVPMVPGKKNDPGSESYFAVNTDLSQVFPTEGEPQPYLTDFSKIQG